MRKKVKYESFVRSYCTLAICSNFYFHNDPSKRVEGREEYIFSAETNFFHGFAMETGFWFLKACDMHIRAEKTRIPITKTMLDLTVSHFS